MKELDDQIKAALSFDPIAVAEELTGKSTKDSDEPAWVGLGLQMGLNKHKEELLKLNDDTHFGITIPEFQRLLGRMRFTMILEDAIPKGEYSEGDFYRIYWHEVDGILISFDSFNGDKCINGGNVYLCFRGPRWNLPSCSHGNLEGDVDYVGHDIREGLRHFLNAVRATGQIVPNWPRKPWLWLLHYMDTKTKDYDHDSITMGRIKRLPKSVQERINPLTEPKS